MSKGIQFKTHNNEKVYPYPFLPVGSIYISINSTNPSTYFGGTWEQIKDRFLLSAGNTYSAGGTGGNASHSHGFRVGYFPYYGVPIGDDDRCVMAYDYDTNAWKYGASDSGLPDARYSNTGVTSATRSQSSAKYSVYGKTTTTNSMPPYLVVYMWKRVL